jgi:hypothetical protein
VERTKREDFIKSAERKKADLIPILKTVLPACLFIFGHSSSLEELLIEKTPVVADKAEEFSRLSTSSFERYFTPVKNIS